MEKSIDPLESSRASFFGFFESSGAPTFHLPAIMKPATAAAPVEGRGYFWKTLAAVSWAVLMKAAFAAAAF